MYDTLPHAATIVILFYSNCFKLVNYDRNLYLIGMELQDLPDSVTTSGSTTFPELNV